MIQGYGAKATSAPTMTQDQGSSCLMEKGEPVEAGLPGPDGGPQQVGAADPPYVLSYPVFLGVMVGELARSADAAVCVGHVVLCGRSSPA